VEKIDKKPQVLVLIGPTAIGKTALSLLLAHHFNCEIVSVDSMQVYRYMDIGTAKASTAERRAVPHHLIDIVDPDEDYDAARFVADTKRLIHEITMRDKLPLLTGGTGLYLKSLIEGIFPEAPADKKIRDQLKKRLENEGCDSLYEELLSCDCISAHKIHRNDSQRLLRALEVYHLTGIPWSTHLLQQKEQGEGGLCADILQVGLTCNRERLYQRINMRCEIMIESGLEKEVAGLLDMGFSPELKAMGAIGYRHMIGYLNGLYNKDEMLRLLARDTRHYAKRQYTWFNRNENIEWVDMKNQAVVTDMVEKWRIKG
jgi:tRNA dimethylallyltransferase